MCIIFVATDGVNNSADGVRAVQQRCRALDHLEPLEVQGVNRFAMIARLGTEGTGSNSILQHQHAVALKSSNGWPRCTRAESSFTNTGLSLEDLAYRRTRLLPYPSCADCRYGLK